jgi:hypothetical protein
MNMKFKDSTGCLHWLWERYGTRHRTINNEKDNPLKSGMELWKYELQEMLKQYSAKDEHHSDKTLLFYKYPTEH